MTEKKADSKKKARAPLSFASRLMGSSVRGATAEQEAALEEQPWRAKVRGKAKGKK